MTRIAIVDGVRTPFLKFNTEFGDVQAYELAKTVIAELLARTEFRPDRIDEVIMGCVANPVEAANAARVASLLAGLPEKTGAVTVSRNCASGFESVTLAAEKILAGSCEILIAGGMESMSNIPLVYRKEVQNVFMAAAKAKTPLARIKEFLKLSPKLLFSPVIGLELGLTDPVCGLIMGKTAEILAREWNISRLDQDEFALKSHKNAFQSREKIKEEIVPVFVSQGKGETVTHDNGVRDNQTIEALSKLKPIFERKNGTVTAGNSSQITDGAVAMLVMKETEAKAMGFQPLGYIRSWAYAGLDPKRMGLGPAYAIPKALDKAGMTMKDIDLWEINEAFAAQVIACTRALASEKFCKERLGRAGAVGDLNPDLLNINGGSIAIGHPVGSSGSRLILTVLKELRRRGAKTGCVSLCIGGGQGGAVVLERE